MSFDSLVDLLDTECLTAFGLSATLHPQAGGSVALTGITVNPALAEDYVPGSSQGVSVVRLFVRFADISPSPQKGDTVTLNGITYDLFEVAVDREGGAVLKLRRNG